MITSILIDATHLGTAQPTGVEAYVRALLPALSRLLMEEKVTVTWVGHEHERPECLPEGVQWLYSPHTPFWSQRRLPTLLKATEPDLFYTPSGIPPLRWHGKTAMTVHDMATYLAPEAFSPADRFRLGWLSAHAAHRASRLIVPSRYTFSLVERFWKIPPARLVVVPHGPTLDKDIAPEVVAGCDPENYFLFVGRLERKKNLLPLIAGFSKYAAKGPGQLVLAGKEGHGIKEIRHAIARLPEEIRARVILPGYVSVGQKRWLMEHAKAVLVPSIVEGFGMPVLEGFAAGVPVLCSQAGSLPEIAGNAALYSQPDIGTDWFLQMQKLDDVELRHKMVLAGKRRLEDFSWERAAEGTAGALLSLG